ncbi:MAG: response regulator, partial [Chloroflexota bacterium]
MSTISILIINNNANSNLAYSEFLQDDPSTDYDITCAESAKAGLAILTTYQPDVILLHDHLPDMTGINFFTQLQQQYPH